MTDHDTGIYTVEHMKREMQKRLEHPDAAPPKEEVACGSAFQRCTLEQFHSGPCAAPPSDAAQPVAIRWRRTDLPLKPQRRAWVYWYPDEPIHHDPRRNDLAGRDDVEVQAVYAHPTLLDVERVLATMLSVIHTWHGDVGWEIYRDCAPELAEYRAFVGNPDPPGPPDVPPPKQKRYA